MEIEVYSKDSLTRQQKVMFRYRNSSIDRFFELNFTLKTLLQFNISSMNIIYLVTQLLLERKVLLVSAEYSKSAILIESLLSLLYPLYFYIPSTIANGCL
jgi:hypothetical protein